MQAAHDTTTSGERPQFCLQALLFLILSYHKESRRFDEHSANTLVSRDSLIRLGFAEEVIRSAEKQGYLLCKPLITFWRGEYFCAPAVELTEAGVAAAWRVVRHQPGPSVNGKSLTNGRRRHKPRWDRQNRNLYYGDALILHFRREAPNQMAILDAFQELHWPTRIDDPLPPRGGVDRRERLHDAIKNLNAGHAPRCIVFTMEADGQGVRWSEAEGD